MNQIFVKFLWGMCLLSAISSAFGQIKIVRGEGALTVQSGPVGPSDAERASTLATAKLGAWRSYLAMPGQGETVDQIRANERVFLDQIDNLLVDVVTVDESFNKDSKRYTIRIKATVAESVLNSMLRDINRSGSRAQTQVTGSNSALGGAPILLLAMAREADSVKSYMEKQTSVSEISRDSESNRSRQSAGGRTAESAFSTDRIKEASGGNRERKRDQITFRVGDIGLLNSRLPRMLLQNNVKATPYAFLMRPCRLPNPDSFSKQYAASDLGALPSNVLAEIQENLLACQRAKYWVFASMDVGGYGTDPNSGMNLATVSVNVQLYEVDTGAQVAAASKDVSARSADQSDAIKVASERAVQAVGDIITAQVSNLGR